MFKTKKLIFISRIIMTILEPTVNYHCKEKLSLQNISIISKTVPFTQYILFYIVEVLKGR